MSYRAAENRTPDSPTPRACITIILQPAKSRRHPRSSAQISALFPLLQQASRTARRAPHRSLLCRWVSADPTHGPEQYRTPLKTDCRAMGAHAQLRDKISIKKKKGFVNTMTKPFASSPGRPYLVALSTSAATCATTSFTGRIGRSASRWLCNSAISFPSRPGN